MSVPAPATTPQVPTWLNDIAGPAIEIAKVLVNALSTYDWAKNFPDFAGLISALIGMLQALLGVAASKVAPVTAAS